MDIFDLYNSKPGMIFCLKLQVSAGTDKCRESLKRLNGKQIEFLDIVCNQADPPPTRIFYIKLLTDFDAISFIRNMHQHVTEVTCLIPTGAHFIETSLPIIQHRYASTTSEDSNQGFAHILEIINPPANKPSFILHGFEHGKGHQIYECESLEKTIELYETMLSYGFPALKGNTNISHSYEIARGQPWFYAP